MKSSAIRVFSLLSASPTLCVVWLLLLQYPSPADASTATKVQGSLICIGVINELEDEHWRDARIGFGLNERIAQYLFDSGYFQLLEEDQEKLIRKKEIVNSLWKAKGRDLPVSEIEEYASYWGADYVAYGRILSFKSSKTKAFAGPISRNTRKTIITVEICLYSQANRGTICKKGKGKAAIRSMALLFEFRGDQLQFDKTSAGKATDKAVREAIKKVLKKGRKTFFN